jgi:uncharacterized protein (DUF1684 family)
MAGVTENDTEFWFIFRDLTSSDETYPAARFLYAAAGRRQGATRFQ